MWTNSIYCKFINNFFIASDSAKECVETFLTTPFEGGRHQARIDAIPVKK